MDEIHFDMVPSLGQIAGDITSDPEKVTCPLCKEWLRHNAKALET